MVLPARIKLNIREIWSKSDSDVQKSFSSLKSFLGYDVLIEPEWALLWTALSNNYPDPSTFVPSVASIVAGWCKAMTELAEDEGNSAWTDELLEKLTQTHALKLLIEVSDGRPTTAWLDRQNSFEICFPKSAPPMQSTMIAGFHSDLRSAFNSTRVQASHSSQSVVADNEEAFMEVDPSNFDSASVMTPATTNRLASRPLQLDSLPDINMIGRPEDPMKKPTYHLIVSHSLHGKEISVQCSHQPSLDLMAGYFKRWVKLNHGQTTKPPAADITLKESCFGLGLVYDRLEFVINSYDNKHGVTPVLILNFNESVLGYRMTFQESARWNFRRDTALR